VRRKNRDEFAATGQASRAARIETWRDIGLAAGIEGPLQLTASTISSIMAALRVAGYRSPEGYLSLAKEVHIKAGRPWDDVLALHARTVTRACRRADPLPLLRLADLPGDECAWGPGGPLNPRRFLVVGSWWLMREIELSLVKICHVRFDGSSAIVTLPVSKNDPFAVGCSRAHTCTCSCTDPCLCPACELRQQVAWAKARPNPDLLFTTSDGTPVRKAGAAATIVEAARRLGLPLKAHNGASRFSGHSLQASGAVFFAESGIDVWRIQLLGRWGSTAIKSYIRDAPLAAMGTNAVEAIAGRSLDELKAQLAGCRAALQSGSKEAAEQPAAPACSKAQPPEHHAPREGLALPWMPIDPSEEVHREAKRPRRRNYRPPGPGELFITSASRHRVHRVSAAASASDGQRTECGWKPPGDRELLEAPPEASRLCVTCFGTAAELSDDSSSSKDASSSS
jgi:hypothetical protein